MKRKPLDSPLRIFGGKYRMLDFLLPLLPEHRTWVDVFFGGGSLTFAKPPAPVEIVNDLDSEVVNFFRVLRDPEKAEALFRLCALTPYCRAEFLEARDSEPPESDTERAYRFFIVNRMSYGGGMKQWSYSQTLARKRVAASVDVWLKGVDCLPQVATRLLSVQVEQDHFREIIPRYDTKDTLFYLDPPYHPDTRVRGGYSVEMTAAEHEELTALLLGVKGMAVLSGYQHPCHDPLEAAGWLRMEHKTNVFASGKGAKKSLRTESVWLNPAAQKPALSLLEEATHEAA